MKLIKTSLLLLTCITILGGFLRLYRLDTLPPSLEWDEVATGYDAYSILKTGRDQYGKWFPLTFRSLDDYKPPLYTYLTVASVALLGWNDFSVRFPAALFGTLAIITTFGMVEVLFHNRKLSLLSALFLAISPWHVNFSRLALETNTTIFFTTAAVWAFMCGLRRGRWLILSAILFGLDLYLYHNARIFVPLFGLILAIAYKNQLLIKWKSAVVAAIIFSIFVIRLIPIATSIEGRMRFEGTSIFTAAESLDTTAHKQQYETWRTNDNLLGQNWAAKLFHNSKFFYGLIILKNYLSHFDPNFWLFTRDYVRHHATDMGLLYFVDIPFVYLGAYFILARKSKKAAIVVLSWLLLAPVAASVTRDVPHALRSELMLPMFQIFIAAALIGIIKYLREYQLTRWVFVSLVAVGYMYLHGFFLHQYFVHFAADSSKEWVYGRKEAAEYVEAIKHNYDRVIVSTRLEQPHVFFLYYLRYDPQKYLNEGGTVSGGWAEDRNHFDQYYFKPIDYAQMSDGKTLFVGTPDDFPSSIPALHTVRYLDGTEAIRIVSG